jgi:hypothetical protein
MSAGTALLVFWPTAQQSDAEAHVTPERLLEPLLGELTIDHDMPFQRSMSV